MRRVTFGGEAKGPVPMRAAAVGGPPVRGENGDHGRVGAQSRAVAASSSDAALACAELPRDRQLGLSGWASARGQSAVVRGVDRGPRRMCGRTRRERKSTRLNSSHVAISYAVFCLKKKTQTAHAD